MILIRRFLYIRGAAHDCSAVKRSGCLPERLFARAIVCQSGGVPKWQGGGLQNLYAPVQIRPPPPDNHPAQSSVRTAQSSVVRKTLIATIRWKTVQVAVRIVSHGGEIILKLADRVVISTKGRNLTPLNPPVNGGNGMTDLGLLQEAQE